MFYPNEVLNEVIAQNDIVQIISEYITLKKKGKDYFGQCPFHSDNSPSFSVSPDKQLYYCFGCGVSGNVCRFIMNYENLGFIDAIKKLADRINYVLPEKEYSKEYKIELETKKRLYEVNKSVAKYCYLELKAETGRNALKYLYNRKIEAKTIGKFGLGYLPKKQDALLKYLKNQGFDESLILKSGLIVKTDKGYLYDRFTERLMFPIFDKTGRITGFGGRIIEDVPRAKYINSPDTPIFDKSKNLYGVNFANKSRRKNLILVEGYLDVISVHQAGFDNAVAALGTSFNITHAKNLKSCTDSVIILFDADAAGQNAIHRAIPFLEQAGLNVKAVTLKGAKDPDEFINNYGKDAFEDAIEKSETSVMFKINSLENEYDLSKVSDKITYTEKASTVLSKIDNDIELNAYIKEVSQKSGIDISAIKTEIEKQRDNKLAELDTKYPSRYNHAKNNNLNEYGLNEAKKHLCSLLINDERVFNAIYDNIKPIEMGNMYDKLLELIYELKVENPEKYRTITPSILVTYFENKEQNLISEVFASIENADYTAEELSRTLRQLIKTIKMSYISERFKNSKDADELSNVIKEKHNLSKLHIKVLDG